MSLYNEDELIVPVWIDKQFLTIVLQEYEKENNIEIFDFLTNPACVKGDHYASVMFRCKIKYKSPSSADSKHKSFIIKTLPMEESQKREMLITAKLFETEIEMYTTTLPKIENILAECGEQSKLSARIIYSALEPHKVIVLEDLCELGHDTVRCRYLTESEVKAVYCKLAKLHAVSYMLSQSAAKELITKYQTGLFNTTAIMSNDIIQNGIKKFSDMLAKHEEFQIYYEKIEAIKSVVIDNCQELYNAYKLNKGQGDVFVLNHGDFHMKNLMFKFNSTGHMEDVIMVDYQISCFAPSCIDLIYSQYMILSPELRLRKQECMEYYFEQFSEILRKINFAGLAPRYSDLQMAALKYRHFSVFLLSTFLPIVIAFMISSAADLKDIDAAKFMENPDVTMSTIYENPEFIKELRTLMPVLLREGYLD